MRIIVVGAGTVGTNIAQFLAREGHDVIVVDTKPSKLTTVEEQLDVQIFAGNACDPKILKRLDVAGADLLLAVTEKDETNLICAYAAKRMGAKRVTARVRSRFYYEHTEVNYRDPLGIDLLISPEVNTAHELANFVSFPSALAMTTMARGRIHLRTLKVSEDSPFAGKTVQEIHVPEGALLAAIRRDDLVSIPRGGTKIEANDRLTLIGLPAVLDKLSPLVDLAAKQQNSTSVVIAGAGETGMALSETLEKRGHQLMLIERSLPQAEEASERLRKARILHGDATDINFLREHNVGAYDYYIAATGDDENNIMSSLLARELGVKKTACLIDRPDYTKIVEKIGIDVAISPRFVVANRVLALVKRGRIRSVTLLEEGELEISEYQALSKSGVTGKKIKDLDVPAGALIGALLQGDEVVIPRGDSVIKPGNIVIAVALADDAERLDNLFAENTE